MDEKHPPLFAVEHDRCDGVSFRRGDSLSSDGKQAPRGREEDTMENHRHRPFIEPWRTALLGLAVMGPWASSASAGEPLDFDQRVACRQAIEGIRWQHRIWPAANPSPKPPLAAVLPLQAIERDVERSLRLSGALEQIWQRPVTASDLAAELGRIFRDTREPEQLDDLVRALDRDGYLVAECLARPLLVERLARSYFADDERFGGGDTRPSFEEWLAGLDPELENAPTTAPEDWTGWSLPELGGGAGDFWTPTAALPESTIGITAVWTGTEMIVWGGGRNTGGRYDPPTDSWTSMAMIGAPSPAPRPHGGVDRHRDDRLGRLRPVHRVLRARQRRALQPGGRLVDADGIEPDLGATLPHRGVDRHRDDRLGRRVTGSMGNNACEIELGQGGRYDPATDTWAAATTSGEPTARTRHRAVWTGDEMIVWGGVSGHRPHRHRRPLRPGDRQLDADHHRGGAGAAQRPHRGLDRHRDDRLGRLRRLAVRRWHDTLRRRGPLRARDRRLAGQTSTGAPDARADHTAVWTGDEMIVWGGQGQDGLPARHRRPLRPRGRPVDAHVRSQRAGAALRPPRGLDRRGDDRLGADRR